MYFSEEAEKASCGVGRVIRWSRTKWIGKWNESYVHWCAHRE